jgi:hypothetical protein
MITQHPDLPITIPYDAIKALCEQYHIARLALFGSVLRDDFDPARSDIDVLVEFLPDARIGWEFVDIQQQLTSIFQREVDLHTPRSIHHRFRDHAVATAQVIYEHAG